MKTRDGPAPKWDAAAKPAEGKIRVVQFKTGTTVAVPILDASPLGRMYLAETAFDRSFSVAGYGNSPRDSHRVAALQEDCVTRDLREAAGRLLAEAGASTEPIMVGRNSKSTEPAELQRRAMIWTKTDILEIEAKSLIIPTAELFHPSSS